jgi:hypothetical protein
LHWVMFRIWSRTGLTCWWSGRGNCKRHQLQVNHIFCNKKRFYEPPVTPPVKKSI